MGANVGLCSWQRMRTADMSTQLVVFRKGFITAFLRALRGLSLGEPIALICVLTA